MSLYQRGDSWQCRIIRGGARYQRSFGAVTLREAKDLQAQFLAEIKRGEVTVKSPTLEQFGERFKAHLPSRVRASSIRLYEQCWIHLVEQKSPLANLRLDEITRAG
jgi:hypothetical protein